MGAGMPVLLVETKWLEIPSPATGEPSGVFWLALLIPQSLLTSSTTFYMARVLGNLLTAWMLCFFPTQL